MDIAGVSSRPSVQPQPEALPQAPSRAGPTSARPPAQAGGDAFVRSGAGDKALADEQAARPGEPRAPDGKALDPEQQREVLDLQRADRAVRAHEAAHKAVGGSLAGGVGLEYATGPDGRQYAVGGEVGIDVGREKDPQATIAKMQRVIAAALAPADPSSQDRSVAAEAQATMSDAQRELTSEKTGSASSQDGAAAKSDAKVAHAYGTTAGKTGSGFSRTA